MIKCLPKEVQGKLRSGVALPSLQQCVEELVLNSIDAGTTCIGVRVDMDAFKVQVIDNGGGLSAEDLGCVGNRYYTSKCNSLEDLEDLKFYGFRGESLASIVSLATLVEISSRTKVSVKTYVKIFRDGKGLDVFEAETSRPSAGTTVTVCNYFHNMPVRRKRMDAVLENERIRQRVEAISLMHPSVSFTLKNDCTGAMVVQLSKARNTYYRFVQVHNLGRAQKLGEINYSCGQFEVTGYIGREGHYNNSLQFLYVNERLLLKTRIHKLLNALLRRLSSSNQKNESPVVPLTTRSPKHKRSQDLYGVYIINIKCPYSEYDICLEPAKTLIEFKDWDGILQCVDVTVRDFLSRENLVPELSQDDMQCVSPQTVGTNSSNQTSTNTGTDVTMTSTTLKIDSSIETALASVSVYRKCNDMSVVNMASDQFECEDYDKEQIMTHSSKNIEASRQDCLSALEEHDSERHDLGILNADPNQREVEDMSEKSSHVSCILASAEQPEYQQPEPPKETVGFQSVRGTSSNTHTSSTDCITEEMEPITSCQQSFVNTRKVILSDPYVHECLQTQEHFQSDEFHREDFMRTCKDKTFAPKRKISLNQKTSWEDVFKGPAPIKIRKISISNVSQSLDQFRRIYGKSETNLEGHLKQSRPHSECLNHNRLFGAQKTNQGCDATDTKEEQGNNLQRSLTLSESTTLKPASCPNKEKKSLAAKVCHLRQQNKAELCVTTHVPTNNTASKDTISVSGGCVITQDNKNNSEDPCNTGPNSESRLAHYACPQQVKEGQETSSDDWLSHYDSSVGKTVYVNKVTGLSRYEEPSLEQTLVCCTSDVTNMAVSVISQTGVEYTCYPFQMDVVLPFLPKSKTERVCCSGPDDRGDGDESSNSLFSLYSKWNNPVFVRPPKVGVDISCGQADGLAVKIHNILFPYRFSKTMIQSMKVINQVDKKFLACLIDTREDKTDGQSETAGNLLVLLDQHAAHERVRLENLIENAYEDDPDAPGEKRLCSSTISPPLEISVPQEEQRLLRSCQAHLRGLGLEVKFSRAADAHVLVGKVPLCFTEKDINERKRGRSSVFKPIVEEYLREQIELLRSAGRFKGTLPLTVLKVLASFACHGAIKFNDTLTKDECSSLVASLSACQLPFQCAHGRPSIAPLVDLLHVDKEEKELPRPNLLKLRRMYKAWQLFGNR